MSRVITKTKKLGEVVPVVFDFVGELESTETIDTATVTISVYSGVDSVPSAMLSGSPAIDGSEVSQLIEGGVLGCIYDLLCHITTSLDNEPELSTYLAVVENLP